MRSVDQFIKSAVCNQLYCSRYLATASTRLADLKASQADVDAIIIVVADHFNLSIPPFSPDNSLGDIIRHVMNQRKQELFARNERRKQSPYYNNRWHNE